MSDPIAAARAAGRTLLTEVESKALLHAAGVPVAISELATTGDEAAKLAKKLGYPVVMKVVSGDIAHKSDVGGVALNLKTAKAVKDEFEAMMARVRAAAPNATIDGVAIQHQAEAGTEVIVGLTTDPQFGPVMMFGLGGIFVEVLKDVAFRIVPLEARDASQLVREIKAFPVLEGVRGQAGADLDALERLLLQVSEFAVEHPEVRELDLNPVIARPDGAIAVDARVVLTEA
jgi:acyl-CoA synthetase (NDP forming)